MRNETHRSKYHAHTHVDVHATGRPVVVCAQAKLSEAHRSHAAAVQHLQAYHAKALKKAEASHAAAMSKVQTEAEAQLDSLTKQMEQLKRDVQAQLTERSEAEDRKLKDLEQR